MNKRNKAARLAGLIGTAFCVLAGRTDAVMLTDWNATNVIVIGDTTNDQAVGARNIVGFRYRDDGGFHYFRMDLGAPQTPIGGQFAQTCSIQIDAIPGGGANTNTGYIAHGLRGIDQMLSSHYSLTGWTGHHRHNYLGPDAIPRVDTTSLLSLGCDFDESEDAGAGPKSMIQWAIPHAALMADTFTFWGATGESDSGETYDITGPLTTEGIAVIITNIASLATNQVLVEWVTYGGHRYRLQHSENLVTDVFQDIPKPQAQEMETNAPPNYPDSMSIIDQFEAPQGVPTNGQRFYRIHTVAP
jgi:hypothetical protein